MRSKRRAGLVAACWGALLAAPLAAQQPAAPAADAPRSAAATVFERYAGRILKVQVVEVGSAAKVSTGTAFFVDAGGYMLTNYHVVAEWIHEPRNHRVDVVHPERGNVTAQVVAIDVVADLAVLATALEVSDVFSLDDVSLRQGERLYSLGHPGDLGLSIVEGTYNGLLRHTLHPKIHFTGSINPGMSGGPTITERGEVVGVNVSTMGEQRGFLVPRARAAALVASARRAGWTAPKDFLAVAGEQLRTFQEAYLTGMLEGDVNSVEIGRFRVVTEPSPVFRCWGNAERDPELLVETLEHYCDTEDDVFIAAEHSAGVVSLHHQVLRNTGMSGRRFTRYLQGLFAQDVTPGGDEAHVTPWACTTRNVRWQATVLRVAYCVRRYLRLGELYDSVVRAAVLGDGSTALVSTLTLSGVSRRNSEWLSMRWLEVIGWR